MRVQLSVSGANLEISDSFASATLVSEGAEEGFELGTDGGEEKDIEFSAGDETNIELGKTEVVEGTTNPFWTKSFMFDYDPEQSKFVTIGIYDNNEPDCAKGLRRFSINQLLEARGNALAKESKAGIIVAHAAEHVVTGSFKFQLRGHKLDNMEGFFWRSDPFFTLEKGGEELFRSEAVMDNLNPEWPMAEVELSSLCGDFVDLHTPLKISVFDREEDGDHELIGVFEMNMKRFLSADPDDEIILTREGDDNAGKLYILSAELDGFVDTSEATKTAMEIVGKAEAAKVTSRIKEENSQKLSELAESKEDAARKLVEEAEAARGAATIAAEEAEAAKAALEEALSALESL